MRKGLLLSLLFIVFVTNVNAQILGDRLIALTNADRVTGSFIATDSTTYHYKGTYTSNMKTGVYNYDTSIMYTYNGTAYLNSTLSTKGYNGFDSVTLLRTFNWNDTTSNWDISADFYVNNNFDMTSHLIQNRTVVFSASPSYNLFYTYDGSNNLIEVLKTGASLTDTQQRIIYTYSGSNLTTSVTQNWLPFPTPGFQNFQEIDYTYNSLNLDTFKINKSWNPILMSWNKDNITKYFYDAGNKQIAAYYSSSVPSLGFVSSGRDTVMYDSVNNISGLIHQSYDTFSHTYINAKQTTWTYNGKWHVPLLKTTFSWTGSSWTPLDGQDNQTRYYYEEYTNAVPYVNKAISSFEIFPVPAANFINIRMKWSEPQAFTVAIYDLQGRLLQQTGESATSNYQRTVSVSDLSSGNYIVRIKGADTEIAQSFTVSK